MSALARSPSGLLSLLEIGLVTKNELMMLCYSMAKKELNGYTTVQVI